MIHLLISGNCDNCTILKREQDMSKESYILMACIQACGGNWGLNIPIDVLHGSRVRSLPNVKYTFGYYLLKKQNEKHKVFHYCRKWFIFLSIIFYFLSTNHISLVKCKNNQWGLKKRMHECLYWLKTTLVITFIAAPPLI